VSKDITCCYKYTKYQVNVYLKIFLKKNHFFCSNSKIDIQIQSNKKIRYYLLIRNKNIKKNSSMQALTRVFNKNILQKKYYKPRAEATISAISKT